MWSHFWKQEVVVHVLQSTAAAAVCLWAHIHARFYVICFGLALFTQHTLSLLYCTCVYHLNDCHLCATLNFHLHSFGSSCLTGNGWSADQTTPRTCSPKSAIIHRNRRLFWQQSVRLPLPLCERSAGLRVGLLLAKPHSFPLFHHSPALVGSHANGTWWRGRTLRSEFPPSLGCPQPPPPFLPLIGKCLSSHTEQSVLR